MAPPTTITLGGLFPSSGGWAVGPTVIPAFTLAIEEINASPTLLPSTTLLYHHNDSACSAITGLSALHYQNTFPNSIDAVIGDGCSTACQLQAKTCEAWKMPQLSWGCVSPVLSDKTEFPYFLRTVSPDTQTAFAFSDFIHTRTPWRNVAWVCEDENLFTLTAAAFQEAQLDHPADPITTRHTEIFQPTASLAALSESVSKIKESRAKIIFVAAYSNNIRTLLTLLHDAGLTQPGFQLFIAGSVGDCVLYNPICPGPNGETTETDPVVLAAAQGAIFTVLHNPTASPAYQTFASKMVTRMNLDSPDQVNIYAATAYEAVYSYANALHTFAGDVRSEQDKPLFLEHLRASSTPGVVTQIVDYDSNGDRVSTLAITNFNTTATSTWNPIFLWNKRAGLITQPDFLPPLYTGSTPGQPSTDMIPLSFLPSLTLGGNFPVTGGWPVGSKIIPAVELAIEEINASPDLLPATTLKLYVNDSACDADIGLKNLLWQDEHPRSIDMILGDGCSTACEAQAAVAAPKQLPQISYSCTSPALSDKLRFPYFLRTLSPDTVIGEAFASFVLSATPWHHVAFLSENYDLFTLAVEKFEETNRKQDLEDKIQVDHYIFADGDSLEQHMQNLAASGVRIWVANAYSNNVRSMLKIGKRLGIAGEGYQVLIGGGMPDCVLYNPACPGPNGEVEELDLDILAAAEGALSTLPFSPVGEPAYEAIMLKMIERTSAESAADVNPYALNAYEAVYAYAHAADSFNSAGGARNVRTHKYEFMEHLKTSVSPGVNGEVRFDANGDRILRLSFVTFDYGLNGDKSNGMYAPVYTFSSTSGLAENEGVQFLWTGGVGNMLQVSHAVVVTGEGGDSGGLLAVALGAGAVFLAAVGVTVAVEKFSKTEPTFTLEAELTLDEKMKKECNVRIRSQYGWLFIELVDATSDIANGVMVLVEGTKSTVFTVLFSVVAVLSLFAGIHAVVRRRQVLVKFGKIRDGDPDQMDKYKNGDNSETGGKVTFDNPALRWDLTTMEMHAAKMGIINCFIEDVPGLVLNAVALVLTISSADFKSTPQFFCGFAALLVGCISAGRKSYLGEKLAQLRILKGEIEATMGIEVGGMTARKGAKVKRGSIAHTLNSFKHLKKVEGHEEGSETPLALRIATEKGRIAEAERGSGAKVNPVLG